MRNDWSSCFLNLMPTRLGVSEGLLGFYQESWLQNIPSSVAIPKPSFFQSLLNLLLLIDSISPGYWLSPSSAFWRARKAFFVNGFSERSITRASFDPRLMDDVAVWSATSARSLKRSRRISSSLNPHWAFPARSWWPRWKRENDAFSVDQFLKKLQWLRRLRENSQP